MRLIAHHYVTERGRIPGISTLERALKLELTPRLYHNLIRPKWITKKYIHDLLNDHIQFQNRIILDFGCGTGANCCLCDAEHYLGVDPDKHRVDFAKNMYPEYKFETSDGSRLPAESGTVDLVLIIAVLHHIPSADIPAFVKEFRRVLKAEGGQVAVIEPCLFDNTRLSNWFMKKYDKGKYIQGEKNYLDFFQDGGFACKVIKKYSKCFMYNELFFVASTAD